MNNDAQEKPKSNEFETLKNMPQNIQFVDQVHQFVMLSGWTHQQLAHKAGISRTVLSQFLNGRYPGDTGKARKKLSDVIETERKRMGSKKTSPLFIETSISTRFFNIADMCNVFNELGVCFADAGLGKTESSKEYIVRKPTSVLIEADPGYTPSVLFHDLYSSLGGSGNHTLHNTFTYCVERLKESGRLLIIDEAEQLPYKSLEMVRRLHDKAKIGVLLTGMEWLLGNLQGFRGQYKQLYSRVGIRAKLSSLTESDVENIVKRQIGDTNELWKIFHMYSNGNTRRLFKLMNLAIRASDKSKCAIDTNVIKYANSMIIGGGGE